MKRRVSLTTALFLTTLLAAGCGGQKSGDQSAAPGATAGGESAEVRFALIR